MIQNSWLNRSFLVGLFLLVGVLGVYAVLSGLPIVVAEFRGLFIIGGLIMTYSGVIFVLKANFDRKEAVKARLSIFFGPGLGLGLSGTAILWSKLIEPHLPEHLSWIPMTLYISAAVAMKVAVVLGLLFLRDRQR
jgi:hypothetical protein